MRVAMFNGAGRPITIERVPDPEPGPEDLVVRVGRCGFAEVMSALLPAANSTFRSAADSGTNIRAKSWNSGATWERSRPETTSPACRAWAAVIVRHARRALLSFVLP